MAANSFSSSLGLGREEECREIHATWDRLNQLGQALACRTTTERRQIRETYRAMYGEDLLELLHKTQPANQKNEMCTILYMLMLDPHERDAVVARDALESSETDYKALVEIYTCRKSNQLFLTKQAYLARFKGHLDQDIISEPLHPYQKILAALAASHRSHNTDINRHIAKCDAKRLYEAGKGSTGAIDESTILEMFSKRSIPQLRLAFSSYKHIYGHDYTKSLKKESCGEFEDSLRAVVKCMYDPSEYYSKMLYTSMKGMATKKNVLSRVMLGSAEVGMKEIKGSFQNKYGMKLQDAICENIPDGDYRDFLVALINAPSSTS